MRYYSAKSEPYVSSYIGNKYQPDLYLKAGAILEDRLNKAEEANAKFQETGELTPGYYTALSGEAEEINQKIRATKQRAAQAASEGKTRELTDALYQGQAIYTSPQAKRVQSDFEKTNKYITPEIVKREGKEGEAFLMRGSKDPNAIRNTVNIPDEWYGLYDNKLSPQSLTYLKNFQADVDQWSKDTYITEQDPSTGEDVTRKVTESANFSDYRRQAFGERIDDKINAMGPDLSNPGEDLSGIFFEKGKGYLGTDATPGSGKDPNHPEWSEMQVKGKEKILDYGNLLYHVVGKEVSKLSGASGSSVPPAKKPRGLEIPHVLGEQFPSSQERGFAEKPIENYSDFEGNYKKLVSPENVYGDVITKYVGDEKTSKALIALLPTNSIEDVVGKIAEVLPEDQVNAFAQELVEKEAKINDIKEDMDLVNLDVSERAKQGLTLPIDDKGNINVPQDLIQKARRYAGYDPSTIGGPLVAINNVIHPNKPWSKLVAKDEQAIELEQKYNEYIKAEKSGVPFDKNYLKDIYNEYVDASGGQEKVKNYYKNEGGEVGKYLVKKDELMKEHFNDPKFQLKGWTPKEFGIKSKGTSVGDVIKDAAISSLEIFPHISPETGEPLKETDLKDKVFTTNSDGTINMVGTPDFSTATLFPDVANGRFMLRYDAYPTEEDAKAKKNKQAMYIDVTEASLQELQKDYPQEAIAFVQKNEMWQELKNLPSEKTKTLDKVFDVSGDLAIPFKEIKIQKRGNSYFIDAPAGWDNTPGKAYSKEEILDQLWKTKALFSGASEEVAPAGKFQPSVQELLE
jgi:hypothetical protein